MYDCNFGKIWDWLNRINKMEIHAFENQKKLKCLNRTQ